MMMDPIQLQTLLDKLTLMAGLAWAVVAFIRGWVVPSSVHAALVKDRNDWRDRADRLAAIAEMTLRAKVGGGVP
jgi:hypothetical protein